jgi:hypothetical protein
VQSNKKSSVLRNLKFNENIDYLEKIERENHILLKRMARQMSATAGFSGLGPSQKVHSEIPKLTANSRKKKELLQLIEESNQAKTY